MNLLLDTNVIVAALIARGVCADLLEHCVREHVVITSQPLLDELDDVLTRKFHQRAPDVRDALRLFKDRFTLVTPEAIDPPVCRDRDDDVVLGTALAGGCAAVVTGDQDPGTRPFSGYAGIGPVPVLEVGIREGRTRSRPDLKRRSTWSALNLR